jgi:hypothetical protein
MLIKKTAESFDDNDEPTSSLDSDLYESFINLLFEECWIT